jgi:hypothetical protein
VSFASIGFPEADFFPETTQLLLAPADGEGISPSIEIPLFKAAEANSERMADTDGIMAGA